MNKVVELVIIDSWWVILFILCCYGLYVRGLAKRDNDFTKLHAQYVELQKDYKYAVGHKEILLSQINSQSDPEWVELTLMKGLGLVPDGQTKVVFVDPS